jgi:hypothetical protein
MLGNPWLLRMTEVEIVVNMYYIVGSGVRSLRNNTNVVPRFVTQAEPLRTRFSLGAAVDGQGRVPFSAEF